MQTLKQHTDRQTEILCTDQDTINMDPTDQAQAASVLHLGEFTLKSTTQMYLMFFFLSVRIMFALNVEGQSKRDHLEEPFPKKIQLLEDKNFFIFTVLDIC